MHDAKIRARFWRKVDRRGPGQCWNWTGSLSKGGANYYSGNIKIAGRVQRSARVCWEIHYGEIPNGAVVRHSCDNPRCCNPAHLSIGTQADNIDDMIVRARVAVGERASRSKLTAPEVLSIRELYRCGGYTMNDLAARFGVANPSIHGIIHRKYWKHI